MEPLIFIVDDDLFFRNYITSILSMNQYTNIMAFSSGELCLEHLNLNPDIIILDHDMHGLSGTDVLEALKQDMATPQVIMVSGRDEEALIAKVINLGVHKFFHKDHRLFRLLTAYFKDNYRKRIDSLEV